MYISQFSTLIRRIVEHVIDGEALDQQGLVAFSKMAGKAETQSRVLFLLNSSATNLARQVQAPAQSLVRVLQAAIDEGKFQ